MNVRLLALPEIEEALCALPEWQHVSANGVSALMHEFVFEDFNAAFGFMSRVAMMAERMDHHPDWSNSFNRVVVSLSTHDVGGVTLLDVRLATFCNAAAHLTTKASHAGP